MVAVVHCKLHHSFVIPCLILIFFHYIHKQYHKIKKLKVCIYIYFFNMTEGRNTSFFRRSCLSDIGLMYINMGM